jgi:hypothetical protein
MPQLAAALDTLDFLLDLDIDASKPPQSEDEP